MAVPRVSGLEAPEKIATPSPKLARSAISEIRKIEETGVPLNTPWTFYLDKYVLRYVVVISVISFFLYLTATEKLKSRFLGVVQKCSVMSAEWV